MERRVAAVLGKGATPDGTEQAALARFTIEGYRARYVYLRWETGDLEPCDVALSQYPDLLKGYPVSEQIGVLFPAAAEGIVPSGFPKLPQGHTLHQSGPRFSLRNEFGTQVHDKMLFKGAMILLIQELTDARGNLD
jgi:hypothetical protein